MQPEFKLQPLELDFGIVTMTVEPPAFAEPEPEVVTTCCCQDRVESQTPTVATDAASERPPREPELPATNPAAALPNDSAAPLARVRPVAELVSGKAKALARSRDPKTMWFSRICFSCPRHASVACPGPLKSKSSPLSLNAWLVGIKRVNGPP